MADSCNFSTYNVTIDGKLKIIFINNEKIDSKFIIITYYYYYLLLLFNNNESSDGRLIS